jgi:hypothetical protein
MKVYLSKDEDNPDIPEQHRRKIALLKLVDDSIMVKDVGMREKDFYLIIENDKDIDYLNMKLIILKQKDAIRKFSNSPKLISYLVVDKDIQDQKNMLS